MKRKVNSEVERGEGKKKRANEGRETKVTDEKKGEV